MRLHLILLAALLLAPFANAGETRSLTSKDGRSIEAEILSYKGDTLRVRRADTKREFTLPISSLSEDAQSAVRDFIRDHPELRETIRPSDVRIEFSRSKFERSVTSDTNWRDETTEHWGYNIQVLNQTNQPLEELRLEYIIFARTDPDNYLRTAKANAARPLERQPGNEKLGAIQPGRRAEIRTTPVVVNRVTYSDNYNTYNSNGRRLNKWRDREIHGVWFRLYDGDKLIQEGGAPESLRKSETWEAP
jgi:hypothetical protein